MSPQPVPIARRALGPVALALVLAGTCTSGDPAGAPAAAEATCTTSTSDLAEPLGDIVVRTVPDGYVAGEERPMDQEDFLEVVGEGRDGFVAIFQRTGFSGAYERTWEPADGPREGHVDEDVIYAYAVCFPSVEQARSYALEGAYRAVAEGTSVSSMPWDDGRFTVVGEGRAATALLRSGRTVVTFTQWSDVDDIDEDALQQLAEAQEAGT